MICSVIGQWLLDGKSPHTGLPVLETRRVVAPKEFVALRHVPFGWTLDAGESVIDEIAIQTNAGGGGYVKYAVGKTYAIQPGRGQRALGRTPRVASIRRQDVRTMTQGDAAASGFDNVYQYLAVWCEMHDPQVTILEVVPSVWLGGLKTEFKRGVCWGQNEFMLGELYQRPDDRYDAWVIRFEDAP